MTLLESDALVVRTVPFGDSDVVATLVTEHVGKVAVVARGARKGSRRLGGALEPIHTIAVRVEERGGDLGTLKEAHLVRVRARVVSHLPSLEAAGVALRWARHLFPSRTPEPRGWGALTDLLDRLEDGRPQQLELARAGLLLLAAVGYGLELASCVGCGRPCPEGKAAYVDPARGGLVCRGCGGATRVLSADVRQAAHWLVLPRVETAETHVSDRQAAEVLQLVDRAMAAHAGFDR